MPKDKYKAPKLKLKTAKAYKPKAMKTADSSSDSYYIGKGSGEGKVELAPVKMKLKPKKKKKEGKIIYKDIGSGKPAEMNIIDARGITRETAKEGLKQYMERGRIDYEKKLQKMIKGLK